MHIDHIAIWTHQIEVLKTFYIRYFGATAGQHFTIDSNQFQSYFLSFASGARLELMQMPSVPLHAKDVDAQFSGLIHLAFSVENNLAVDALTARIERDGLRVISQPQVTADGYYESVVLDPDDNRIEITAPPTEGVPCQAGRPILPG